MITLGTPGAMASSGAPCTSLKIIGVGGTGIYVADRLCLDGGDPLDVVVMHTDAQVLMSSVAPRKVQLGREAARGIGAGADPELGRTAAEEAIQDIRAEVEGVQLVVVCAGLGGGTGSGAAPVVAREAHRAGAVVLAMVTLPFTCQGARTGEQARSALKLLGRHASAVLCFENDRMHELAEADAPLVHFFPATAQCLGLSLRSIVRLLSLPSLMHVGLDELLRLFHGSEARALFGYGEASGPNRCHEALEKALRSPLLDRGRLLGEAAEVLVHIAGDPGLRLIEIQALLQELGRHVEEGSHLHCGIGIDARATDALGVAVLACVRSEEPRIHVEVEPAEEEAPVAHDSSPEPATGTGGDPDPVRPRGSSKGRRGPAPSGDLQPELPLGDALRGRFRDSEPSLVDGEDLDIPAFIRHKVRIK